MFKLKGFSRDDACTPQSVPSLSALNHTVDYISRVDVIFKIYIKGTGSRCCACANLLIFGQDSRNQKNLEKSVCIALCQVPVEFRFGRNRDFLALLLLPLAGGPKMGSSFCHRIPN